MKRKITFVVAAAMVLATFTACGNTAGSGTAKGAGTAGYSVYTYISSSKNATADANGAAEVNSYIAYTAVNEDGKIFRAGIDAAQTKVAFDATGTITADLSAPIQTKNELGDAYGMRKASPIGKEWNEQAQAFADWTIGKTLAEVSNVAVSAEDVFTEADLVSSVTVHAKNFKQPMANSAEHKLTGSVPADAKLGLGVSTSIGSSKSATAEKAGTGQVDSLIAVVALDSSGKIAAVGFDAIQSKVSINADGTIGSDLSTLVKTKKELGADYGMTKASAIGKEWFEQAEAFEKWCIGKTPSEVTSMKTKKVDDNHPQVPDVADLNSSVTITVGDFLEALEKAAANAK